MKKVILITIVVLIAVLGGLTWWSHGIFPFAFLYGFVPSAQDAEEAGGVATFVTQHYSFAEKSKSMPESWPVFCRPGPRGLLGPSPHTLIVYTVTDRQQQDKVIDLVRQYRRQMHLRPIRVEFYRAENWTTRATQDGGEFGFRGDEQLLRTVKVR